MNILSAPSSLLIPMTLVYESDIRPYKVLHPTYRSIRRFVKHELRIDKKLEATA